MRRLLYPVTLASVLAACYTAMPIPVELSSKPGAELRIVSDAAVVKCSDTLVTAKQFWFGGESRKANLCLRSLEYAERQSQVSAVKAKVPSGTPYSVIRRVYWNGVDGDSSFLEIRLPSIMGEAPVILSDTWCEKLTGVKLGPRQ